MGTDVTLPEESPKGSEPAQPPYLNLTHQTSERLLPARYWYRLRLLWQQELNTPTQSVEPRKCSIFDLAEDPKVEGLGLWLYPFGFLCVCHLLVLPQSGCCQDDQLCSTCLTQTDNLPRKQRNDLFPCLF